MVISYFGTAAFEGIGSNNPGNFKPREETFITSIVTHNPRILAACRLQDVALFQEGVAASDAIKLMAEDWDNSALLVRTRVNLFVSMFLGRTYPTFVWLNSSVVPRLGIKTVLLRS